MGLQDPGSRPNVALYGLWDLGSLSFPTCKMGGIIMEQGLLCFINFIYIYIYIKLDLNFNFIFKFKKIN